MDSVVRSRVVIMKILICVCGLWQRSFFKFEIHGMLKWRGFVVEVSPKRRVFMGCYPRKSPLNDGYSCPLFGCSHIT